MLWQSPSNMHRWPRAACLLLAVGAGGCGGGTGAMSPAPPPAQAPEPSSVDADSELLEEKSASEPSGAQPGAPAPAAAQGPSSTDKKERRSEGSPRDLGSAEAELARAQQQLDALYGTPPPADAADDTGGEATGGETRVSKPAKRPAMPRCSVACRAFESLERAAAAICRIAGESSDKCERARGVVEENRSRVAACSCAARSDD